MVPRSSLRGGPTVSRRRFLHGIGLTAGLGALAACGGSGSSGGANEITFACAKLTSATSMAEFTQAYNDSQPRYRVTVRELPPPSSSTEVHQQLVQALSRQDGSVDVFSQDIIWVAEFAGAGWAMKLDGQLNDQGDYFTGLVDGCTFGGALHGVPWYVDAGQIFYRTDIVPAAPTTWDEVVRLGQAAQAAGSVDYGFLWQAKQAEILVCNLVEFVASNGGGILGPDGKEVLIDQPAAVEAVQFMYDLVNASRVSPADVLSWDEEPSRRPFTAGQAAMLRQWSYVYEIAQDPGQSSVVDKVAVAPLPSFPAGKSAACLGGYQLGINASSEKKDAALDFVNWMSSKETQIRFADLFGNAPTRPSAYDDAAMQQQSPAIVQLKNVFEGGTPRPVTPKYPQVSLALQSAVSQALTTGDIRGSLGRAASQLRDIVGASS
jgi:multiple sugar transport system substrate-binding protein